MLSGCLGEKHCIIPLLSQPQTILPEAVTEAQALTEAARQRSLSSTRSGFTQELHRPKPIEHTSQAMSNDGEQAAGMKRERSLSQTEQEASLLQLLRSGSLNRSEPLHQADPAVLSEHSRPAKRQMIQSSGSGGPSPLIEHPTPWPNPSANILPTGLNFSQPAGSLLGPLGPSSQLPTMQEAGLSLVPEVNFENGVRPALPKNVSSSLPGQISGNRNFKAALGNVPYAELRSSMLAQQELFNCHLQELHTISRMQNKSVEECPNKQAMHAEFQKLQAEQETQTVSDNTVQQENAVTITPGSHSQPNQSQLAQSQAKQKSSTSTKAETNKTVDTQAGKSSVDASEAQKQMPFGPFPPSSMMQQGSNDFWNMQRQNYMNHYNQQAALQGWGMPMMNGNFTGSFSGPYGGFGMMPPPMDPMLAWYTLHYGQQYHQAMQNANAAAAKAQQDAQEQDKLDTQNNGGKQSTTDRIQPVRWWQDPEKVFGMPADPAVLANHDLKIAARNRAQEKLRESRSEATSKPPAYKRVGKPGTDVASEKGQSFDKALKTPSKPKSGSASGQLGSKEGHQKAGSGLSAFKSLATKSGRRPPTRAESIGSEMSRSGAERSHLDDADSSDLNHAALGPKGPPS